MDDWGIDICVACSNKCLEAPPGLSILSVGPRAWDLVDRHKLMHHGWYLDLRTWRSYAKTWASWHPCPITMPTNLIMALLTTLRKISRTGLLAHIAKHSRACFFVRTELRNLGFKMLVPDEFAAPTATAVMPRPEFTAAELIAWGAGAKNLHHRRNWGVIRKNLSRGSLGQSYYRLLPYRFLCRS